MITHQFERQSREPDRRQAFHNSTPALSDATSGAHRSPRRLIVDRAPAASAQTAAPGDLPDHVADAGLGQAPLGLG